MNASALHLKYRPQNLDQVIGHETIVTRLQGLVETNKIPNALGFFGPSSSGKTTLARCVAAAINGLKTIGESRDYAEYNGSEKRTIEDVRQMLQLAKYRPQNKKRVICIDEAHGYLTNNIVANAILKPLEEPPKDTLFIICSMEPAKFQASKEGRAILNRCSQFVLEEHTPRDLLKQAQRIAKAEKMTYVLDEDRKILKTVVKGVQEMRSLANVMESLQQYYSGLKEKPKLLKTEHISQVLASTESADDLLALTVMEAVYELKYKAVQRALIDVQDGFMFITKLLYINNFVLNNAILEGARHPKVWGSVNARTLATKVRGQSLGTFAAVNAKLVETKSMAQQFATSPTELLSSQLYYLIRELAPK